MGRGDKRTERGKRTRGSYGNARSKTQLKTRARAAAAKPKTEETPATEPTQAEESA